MISFIALFCSGGAELSEMVLQSMTGISTWRAESLVPWDHTVMLTDLPKSELFFIVESKRRERLFCSHLLVFQGNKIAGREMFVVSVVCKMEEKGDPMALDSWVVGLQEFLTWVVYVGWPILGFSHLVEKAVSFWARCRCIFKVWSWTTKPNSYHCANPEAHRCMLVEFPHSFCVSWDCGSEAVGRGCLDFKPQDISWLLIRAAVLVCL